MRIGIYPGTFDPITYGHLDIIERSLKIVDKLIVAIGSNSNKTSLFPASERVKMVHEAIFDLEAKDRIEVLEFKGLLVDFAINNNSNCIIRGLRAISDFEFEFQMAWTNHKMQPEIETIFLPASNDTQFVSSSFVKAYAALGADVSKFVPQIIADKLKHVYEDKK